MSSKTPFAFTDKQIQALRLMGFNERQYSGELAKRLLFLYGGAGSAKTFINLTGIVKRATLAPRSQHGVFRKDATQCFASLYAQSMPEVMDMVFPSIEKVLPQAKPKTDRWYQTNKQEHTYTFWNGAVIKFLGVYNNESGKIDSVLGYTFNTIFVNEATEISYEVFNYLMTRLRGSEEHIKQLFLLDCNPRSMRHWLYVMFLDHKNPDSGKALSKTDNMGLLQMNPIDNPYLSADYIASLGGEDVPEEQRVRFYLGNWNAGNSKALYALEMARASAEGRICPLGRNTAKGNRPPVHLILDVGQTTAYWIMYLNRAEKRVELWQYGEIMRRSLDNIVDGLMFPLDRGGQGWNIKTIAMGHDALHVEGGSGLSHVERLYRLKERGTGVTPYDFSVEALRKPKTKQENVDALRWWFEYFWFDSDKTALGLSALENCESIDKHDEFLHGVDALMYCAVWCGYHRFDDTSELISDVVKPSVESDLTKRDKNAILAGDIMKEYFYSANAQNDYWNEREYYGD